LLFASTQIRLLLQHSRQHDDKIGTADIPELTEEFWQNAVRNPFFQRAKAANQKPALRGTKDGAPNRSKSR
jgi:hypothetical protein